MRISDWSSDVCSSDLGNEAGAIRLSRSSVSIHVSPSARDVVISTGDPVTLENSVHYHRPAALNLHAQLKRELEAQREAGGSSQERCPGPTKHPPHRPPAGRRGGGAAAARTTARRDGNEGVGKGRY